MESDSERETNMWGGAYFMKKASIYTPQYITDETRKCILMRQDTLSFLKNMDIQKHPSFYVFFNDAQIVAKHK